MPKVSIIMNCHNCGDYLQEALDSVSRQTFRDYEIIFWDNQSTDNSAQIAKSFGAPLRYFRGESFLPLGEARNKAIGEAQGKYIALLDCDDVWLPEKLEKQIFFLENNPEIDLVFSDCYISSDSTPKGATFFDEYKPFQENIFFNLLTRYNFIPCLTAVLKKDKYDLIGGFDSSLTIAEEYDLFLRFTHKYKAFCLANPLAVYRKHQNCFTFTHWEKDIEEKLYVIEKNIRLLEGVSKEEAGQFKNKVCMLFLSNLNILLKRFRFKQAIKYSCSYAKKYRQLLNHINYLARKRLS